MKRVALLLAICTLAQPALAESGKFIGTLTFTDPDCVRGKVCVLKDAFAFKDAEGTGWEARAGLPTDGATIPSWAQGIAGVPFTPAYIKAAVIHDHYCDRHVRSWRSTHRVFYDALLASGVERRWAAIMYFGVYLGGPKWATLVPGKPCVRNKENCVNRLPKLSWFDNAAIIPGELKGEKIVLQGATYDRADFAPAVAKAQATLEANPNVTLDELEQLAGNTRPEDSFLHTYTTMISDDRSGDSNIRDFAP